MAVSQRDPSLRVAAKDPHLVSLGGCRLSTAVTIHNIPVGDCTIGSSLECSVPLIGAGVMPLHCTIYRSENNHVMLVPERNARVLIDNQLISKEVDLRQGTMITIGDSYYLRYNNPAEALQMRSAMDAKYSELQKTYPHLFNCTSDVKSASNPFHEMSSNSYSVNWEKSNSNTDLMDCQCPKVFTAELATANMSARDELGQKYLNFVKNMRDPQCKEKYVNVLNSNAQLNRSLSKSYENCTLEELKSIDLDNIKAETKISAKDHLEDMLKICTEYTDPQDRGYGASNSTTSSPIVQNRIKTNGSLPRDKKCIFCCEFQNPSNSPQNQSPNSSGYESVGTFQQKSNEIAANYKSFGYQNVIIAPQSPRSQIRMNCFSPKKDSCAYNSAANTEKTVPNDKELIKNFEENFTNKVLEETSTSVCSQKSNNNSSPVVPKTTSKNVNNLSIDIRSLISPCNSPTHLKKITPAALEINNSNAVRTGHPFYNTSANDKLEEERDFLLQRIQCLKRVLNSMQTQQKETLIEMNMEHALVVAELRSQREVQQKLIEEHYLLKQKIHVLEAQRNATRVIEENQQSNLNHSIEMNEDQVQKLNGLLNQKPDNMWLKEELSYLSKSLEDDKIYFEDLEFQYLEGESEWQTCRDDLALEEQALSEKIEKYRSSIENVESLEQISSSSQRSLSDSLLSLVKELLQYEEELENLKAKPSVKTSSNSSLPSEKQNIPESRTQILPSLFGSGEMLGPKLKNSEDMMSKSVNENMLNSNKIELLPNEPTAKNSNNYMGNAGSKKCTGKIFGTTSPVDKQRTVLTQQKELQDLNYERRKIEEKLKKLSFDSNQQTISTTIETRTKSGSIRQSKHTQTQCKQDNPAASPASTCSPSLSGSRSEQSNKSSPNRINSLSSSESPKNFHADDKRASSLLPSEHSPQSNYANISCYRKKAQQQKQQRPHTRYLPILAKDLDLRRHIELAGHPVSLCRHVILDSYNCRGYLHKLDSTFQTWSKRWFVLDRLHTALIYYGDKYSHKRRGGAYFSSINEVYMDHSNISKSNRPHSTFIVKTKKRNYYLQASSDTAARIWIDAIITGAQGYFTL